MKKEYYFSTKDLLFIAGFSAIGGLLSTYLNMVGDFFQSLLGFAGTTQWAAGIHILWILLAVGIVNKPGTAVLMGIIKGIVELLSGNTHGVLVLIVDVVAGLVIELVFLLPALNKSIKNILAGGLSAMSNVFVFQLFASVPADSLAFWSMLAVAGIAFLSGIVFGGLLSQVLLKSLAKTGIITTAPDKERTKWAKTGPILIGILVCVLAAFFYVKMSKGEGFVTISGDVATPQSFSKSNTQIKPITVQSSMQGKAGTYTGYPLWQILEEEKPAEGADLVLITATDGYSYFITMDEIKNNPKLILVVSGEGADATYSVVGAENSKAWIRGVAEIIVIRSMPISIYVGEQKVGEFHAQDWQFEMDSTIFDLEEGSKKLQGVAVNKILSNIETTSPYSTVLFSSADTTFSCDLVEITRDDSIRIFIDINGYQMKYLLGTVQGKVFITNIERIQVQ